MRFDLLLDQLYDGRRYARFAMFTRDRYCVGQLRARLLMRAHSLEKGLSLPEVRLRFGAGNLKELASLLDQYEQAKLDPLTVEYRKAVSAVNAYCRFHAAKGIDAATEFPFLRSWIGKEVDSEAIAGTREVTREAVLAGGRGDFSSLALSRHSIRQFEGREVELHLLEEAAALAQRAPSVCNRQCGRLHILRQPALIDAALQIQTGSFGFSPELKSVLVVTAQLACFEQARERNQAFVDGGLFAMSLLHALHSKGLGACCLNWSAGRKKDQLLRSAVPIPDDEVIIMLIGVGHLRERFVVAQSARKPLSDILRVH